MTAAFLLLTFNQERYVGAAIEAALSQGCDVVVSDDGSTDGTRAIVEQYPVDIRPPSPNMGLVGSLYAAAEMTDADILVVGAGDDISEPNRVKRILETWRGGVTCSDFTAIDALGQQTKAESPATTFTLKGLAQGQTGPLGATVAMERSLLSPRIEEPVLHEDRVFPFRALLRGKPITFLDERLVRYRVDGGQSRKLPTSQADYVFRFCKEHGERTLPDARQRLKDAIREGADRSIIAACKSTIADLETRIAMASGRGLTRSLVSGLARGAPPLQLVNHYRKAMTCAS